jgi:hypothetical protein
LSARTYTVTRGYDKVTKYGFRLDEKRIVHHLRDDAALHQEEREPLAAAVGVTALMDETAQKSERHTAFLARLH